MALKRKWVNLAFILSSTALVVTSTATAVTALNCSSNITKPILTENVFPPTAPQTVEYGTPISINATFDPPSLVAGYRWAKIVDGVKTILPDTSSSIVYMPLPDERHFYIEVTFIFTDGTTGSNSQEIFVLPPSDPTPPAPTPPPTGSIISVFISGLQPSYNEGDMINLRADATFSGITSDMITYEWRIFETSEVIGHDQTLSIAAKKEYNNKRIQVVASYNGKHVRDLSDLLQIKFTPTPSVPEPEPLPPTPTPVPPPKPIVPPSSDSVPTAPTTPSEPIVGTPIFWVLIAAGILWILILIVTVSMNIRKHSEK